MGGATNRKSFWADPAGALLKDTVGGKAATFLNPLDPITRMGADWAGKKLDRPQEQREAEVRKQDEIMKRLQLGDNPFLGEEDESLNL